MNIANLLNVFNYIVAIGALVVALDGITLLSDSIRPWIPDRARLVLQKIIPIYMVIIALGAVIGPLVYQYLFALPPCTLCWYQRIFIWPAVILMVWGVVQNDIRHIAKYSIAFASVALIIGIVHYLTQLGVSIDVPCDPTGGIPCSEIDIIVFNFVTIPLMAVCVDLGIIGSVWWMTRQKS